MTDDNTNVFALLEITQEQYLVCVQSMIEADHSHRVLNIIAGTIRNVYIASTGSLHRRRGGRGKHVVFLYGARGKPSFVHGGAWHGAVD